ncbi:MAG: thioredoxin-disulfide reductase [Deltaproteobacteria bacterium]|nr:thioredoxin-disulfide reductase [Deltaproteobacteria bacterium]MBW1813153.1 thioredoxin-disulfide reductase [Deltaproteobacteria bacterium]MBW1847125.1 thioredoxin-disulfide reductase [Deltaproteobacteria bacterium]MBW1983205.1 thioredoxin-disulfide reductase [Deltaproteobacteria bacterium]MBW2179064.1 thioredoxin-disulfide reductase [Deltaproteobacteria bacterium]
MSEVDYDLVIIGGGPAGLTAGLYAARARLNVVLLEKAALGGQVIVSDWVENYPGFPEGLNGFELMQRMADQAKRFGLTIETNEVVSLDLAEPIKKIHLNDKTVTAHTIILATGASPKKLGIPGEDMFSGKGVSFCATCDGPFFKDRVVAAVGGGDTAVKESLFLTKFAKKVYLIHRRDELRATKILQERALENDKIELIWDSVVTSINGGLTDVESLTVKNVKTQETQTLSVDGCFIWVGTDPTTKFLGDTIHVDKSGFIIVDLSMETSVSGVYAAGDVRNPLCRQIVTAVGDAATAVYSAENYLEKITK